MIGTVFRVEHEETGQGCYSYAATAPGFEFLNDMRLRHNACGEHLTPSSDVGIGRDAIVPNEFCGFESMQQLHAWFTDEELSELEWLDYHVIKIENAEITAVGKKQVLFLKPEIPVKTLNKNEILLDIPS